VKPAAKFLCPALVVAACIGAGACKPADKAPASPARTQERAAPAARPAPLDPIGTWTVVGHHMPGISAIGEDEAKARHGQILTLSRSEAVSSNDRCNAPTFAVRTVPAEEYLGVEFKIEPGKLTPLVERDELRLIEIYCSGTPWVGFGALLIEVDADHALTPWDGVFFELERSAGDGSPP
jgi:hypothetical protein